MMRDFSKRQRKILDLILRLSYGCGKKIALIPHQNDFIVAGIYESDIGKEIAWLVDSLVIGHDGDYYWFNKDFDQWRVSKIKTGELSKIQTRLSELLRINLIDGGKRLSETRSQNLVKHEEKALQNTNFSTPKLATAKETYRKLNKDIYRKDKKAEGVWLKTLKELEGDVTKSYYRTWLEKTTGISYKDGLFTIGCPNEFVADYLNSNQRSLIEKMLIGFTQPGIKVEFVILEGGIDD
jgi:hypothetical protein